MALTMVGHNDAQGYASTGTTVTQGSGGNSGAGSGDYWELVFANSGTIVSAAGLNQTRAYLLTRSGTNTIYLQRQLPADQTDFALDCMLNIPTAPSANSIFLKGYSDAPATPTSNPTNVSWAVGVSTTGKLLILAGPSSVSAYVGSDTIPPGLVRVTVEMIAGTSSRAIVYAGHSKTVLADSGVVPLNGALIDATRTIRVGLQTTTTAPASLTVDAVRWGGGGGMFDYATTLVPAYLSSNPGAWVAVGAADIPTALSSVGDTTSYAESVSGGSAVKFRVGYTRPGTGDSYVPEGSLSMNSELWSNAASPWWNLTIRAFVSGVQVASRVVVVAGTASSNDTFNFTAPGDTASVEIEFDGTTQ